MFAVRASDKGVDCLGDYYENEEEGEDRRNEHSFKRPPEESQSEAEAIKKPKFEKTPPDVSVV